MPKYYPNKAVVDLTRECLKLEKEIQLSELQLEQLKVVFKEKKEQLFHACLSVIKEEP